MTRSSFHRGECAVPLETLRKHRSYMSAHIWAGLARQENDLRLYGRKDTMVLRVDACAPWKLEHLETGWQALARHGWPARILRTLVDPATSAACITTTSERQAPSDRQSRRAHRTMLLRRMGCSLGMTCWRRLCESQRRADSSLCIRSCWCACARRTGSSVARLHKFPAGRVACLPGRFCAVA